MYVANTCKYEKGRIKNSWEKVATLFSYYKSTEIFSGAQGQLTLQSVVWSGRISKSSDLPCMSSLPASMKRIGWKTGEKKWQHRFSHYNPMGAICCHENQIFDPIWLQNLTQPFPNPNDASDKISLWSARWLRKYSCLKMWTDARTDGLTDGRRLDWYTISSPWAFGSGELIMQSSNF